MNRQMPAARGGFTAIELLAVIAIIGILAAIAVPAILGALNNVQRDALKLEVNGLAEAVESYRNKYNDYPPDGSDWTVFKRHCQKAFPQILASELALLDPTVGDKVTEDHPQFNFSGDQGLYGDIEGVGPAVRNSADSLITLANGFAAAELKVMDPAEALVFFLGGFSADPKRPFTGPGGPFVEYRHDDEIHYGYNVSRQNPLYEFDQDQLTLITYTGTDGDVIRCSNDERATGGTGQADAYRKAAVPTNTGNDLLPVYLPRDGEIETHAPYVYFDSRTYFSNKQGGPYLNFDQPLNVAGRADDDLAAFGAVYPLYSDQPNVTRKSLPGLPFATTQAMPARAFLAFLMQEPQKFQIIGPGLDGKYGGRLVAEIRAAADPVISAQQTLVRFPSGESINVNGEKTRGFRVPPIYDQSTEAVPSALITRMLDNVSNFSARTFDAGAP